jgi:hypothetical protein
MTVAIISTVLWVKLISNSNNSDCNGFWGGILGEEGSRNPIF